MPETVTDAHPWLEQFQPHQRSVIRAWFSAARLPSQTPEDLVHRVAEVISRKLDWPVAADTQQLCEQTLLALLHGREGARQFAQILLDPSPGGTAA
jgi:hypothetical protein